MLRRRRKFFESGLEGIAELHQGGAHLLFVEVPGKGRADAVERAPAAPPLAVAAGGEGEQERPAVVRVRAPADRAARLQPAHRVGDGRQRLAELAGEL